MTLARPTLPSRERTASLEPIGGPNLSISSDLGRMPDFFVIGDNTISKYSLDSREGLQRSPLAFLARRIAWLGGLWRDATQVR